MYFRFKTWTVAPCGGQQVSIAWQRCKHYYRLQLLHRKSYHTNKTYVEDDVLEYQDNVIEVEDLEGDVIEGENPGFKVEVLEDDDRENVGPNNKDPEDKVLDVNDLTDVYDEPRPAGGLCPLGSRHREPRHRHRGPRH